MSLVVRDAGLLSLLVDHGRTRSRHLGVPLGGAADRAALALGNALVGNPADAVAIEVTLSGPTVEATDPVACVVFGAPFQSAVNGRDIPSGTTFTLEPGDVLRVGGTLTGARGYFCVAGGFEASEILGSRSALEPLRAEDKLKCRASQIEARSLGFVSLDLSPSPFRGGVGEGFSEEPNPPTPFPKREGGVSLSPSPFWGGDGEGSLRSKVLRVLDGPQRDWFTDDSFFAREYEVSPASNRMGLRLKGMPLPRRAGELVSEAVAPGAIQVTNDGLPVVLGVDGQTIGGYPKVAHVIRADLERLAQLRPGDRVRFVHVTPDEAEASAKEHAAVLKDWLTRLRIAERQPEFV